MRITIQLSIFLFVLLFASCTSNTSMSYAIDEIIKYSKKIDIPENDLYLIHNNFQQEAIEIGQPYMNVYDKQFRELRIGTCYEEMPFLLDTLLIQKKIVIDTLEFYQKKPVLIEEKLKQIKTIDGSNIKIDKTKKYYIFYHFALYAEKLDKVKVPPMYERYKDSVQFFFINVDKIKSPKL